MEKAKRDEVSRQMRDWLSRNRHGRLAGEQWRILVFQTVGSLLALTVLLVVLVSVALPGAVFFMLRVVLLGVVLALPVVVIPLVVRARHYARLPLHFTIFTVDEVQRRWLLKRQVLTTEQGTRIDFVKMIGMQRRLIPSETYLAYYLKDKVGNILVSLAPTDHPEANCWGPSGAFQERLRKRASDLDAGGGFAS